MFSYVKTCISLIGLTALSACSNVILFADFEGHPAGTKVDGRIVGGPIDDTATTRGTDDLLMVKARPDVEPLSGKRSYRFGANFPLDTGVDLPEAVFLPGFQNRGPVVQIDWIGLSSGTVTDFEITNRARDVTLLRGFLGNGEVRLGSQRIQGLVDGEVHTVSIKLDATSDTYFVAVSGNTIELAPFEGELLGDFEISWDLALNIRVSGRARLDEYLLDDVTITVVE